jgi:hypothetical protein
MKEFNADSKQCRKTCLAPRYGHPPNKVMLVPNSSSEVIAEDTKYLKATYAFSTSNRIIGLGHFPLDGNPAKVSSKDGLNSNS